MEEKEKNDGTVETNEPIIPRCIYLGYSRLPHPVSKSELSKAFANLRGLAKVDIYVKDIYVNEKKRIVTVKYSDGTVTQSTCSKEDTFDAYIGTCVAIARKFCGSKVKLDKIVAKRTHIQ